jgi:hypothetical protein
VERDLDGLVDAQETGDSELEHPQDSQQQQHDARDWQ